MSWCYAIKQGSLEISETTIWKVCLTFCLFDGDMVLVYDHELKKIDAIKLERLWHGPYIMC